MVEKYDSCQLYLQEISLESYQLVLILGLGMESTETPDPDNTSIASWGSWSFCPLSYNGLPPLQPALLAPFCTTVSVMVYSVVGWRSAPLRYPVLALERALTRPAVPATPALYECRGFESHLGQLFIFSLEKKSCRDRNRFSIDFLSHAACFTSNTVLPLLPLSLPISLFPLPLRLLSSCLFFVLLSSPLTSNFSQ